MHPLFASQLSIQDAALPVRSRLETVAYKDVIGMLRNASRPVTVEFAPPEAAPAAATAAVITAGTVGTVPNVAVPKHTVAVFAEVGKLGLITHSISPSPFIGPA